MRARILVKASSQLLAHLYVNLSIQVPDLRSYFSYCMRVREDEKNKEIDLLISVCSCSWLIVIC